MDRRRKFLDVMQEAGVGNLGVEIADTLESGGFFVAPGSISHHSAYEGGLFDHSLLVVEKLKWLTDKLNLKWDNPRSPFIVGMFHDLCKVDSYKREDIQLKTIGGVIHKPGDWIKVNNSAWGSSHGARSALIASTFLKLTEEEVMCIIHHMGAYEKDQWAAYDAAIRKYPNVLFTHTADMYASKVTEPYGANE